VKTIILPGFSVSNKEWADKTAKGFAKQKIESKVHNWRHWVGEQISPRDQIEDIVEQIGGDKINILAKSVGTYVLSLLIPRIKNQIGKIVLCGIPINDLSEDDLEKYRGLSDINSENIICFQNSTDSHGSYDQIKDFLKNISSEIEVISKPGGSHDYPYTQDFIEFLQD